MGQVSRLAGHAEGNAVTFVSGDVPTAPGQPSWREAVGRYDLSRVQGPVPLYGVLGNPVRASRSPDIHNHVFRSRGRAALYVPLESEDPDPVLDWVRTGRLRGVSVTAPFKRRAAERVDRREPDAERTGAVNTVWMDEGTLTGANTDVEAARALIPELVPPGEPVAVLGAGGAASAVVAAARDLGHPVTVFNRTEATGRALGEAGDCAWGGPPASLDPAAFALVVNATPCGAGDLLPRVRTGGTGTGTAVLDLTYGDGPSDWERLAAGAGFRGGLAFLARQAAGQFRRWTGEAVDPAVFREGLA
jgi:shikimate dehydrogenase